MNKVAAVSVTGKKFGGKYTLLVLSKGEGFLVKAVPWPLAT